MTWRHNSVLNYITKTIKDNLPQHIQVFADLEGHKINGLTIPPHIGVNSSRCYLVVSDSSTQPATVYLFELTICFEREDNIAEVNRRKYDQYTVCQRIYRKQNTVVEAFPLKWVLGGS